MLPQVGYQSVNGAGRRLTPAVAERTFSASFRCVEPDTAMTSPDLHATCISLEGSGVLLRGPSGCGKSDLALRLIDAGAARLIGDDYCDYAVEDGRLIARPRPAGAGLLEVRALGVLRLDAAALAARAAVVAVIDLTPGEPPERLPEPAWTALRGVRLRHFTLDPREPSAAAKVRLAVRLACGTMSAVD